MKKGKTVFILPFVNCDDSQWRIQYDVAYANRYNLPRVRVMRERFQDFGFLKYVFRGVAQCYTWVDEIILLLSQSSQLPDWINAETVRVLYHEDFIDKNVLPTYNSCTIEMFLLNIDTDAEYILYSNDDFYPIKALSFDDYFTEEGYPKIKYQIRKNKKLSMFADTCREMWENTCKAHDVEYNAETFKMPFHDIQPINRGFMLEAKEKYKSFMYSHLEPFREKHQNNQYIYANYAKLSGKLATSTRKFKYLETGEIEPEYVADIIRNRKYDTITLNDSGIDYEKWVRNPQIIDAFESIFPEKCKYEK